MEKEGVVFECKRNKVCTFDLQQKYKEMFTGMKQRDQLDKRTWRGGDSEVTLSLYNHLKGACREMGVSLFSQVTSDEK